MTDVNQVVRQIRGLLTSAGIDSPTAEAEIIVAHILDIHRGKLGVMQALGDSIDEDAVEAIAKLAEARATRIPLQHLTGEVGFYGLDLKVEPGVFLPRVETEVLVETTLEHFAATTGPLNILDLCTGTGAISAALADQFAKQSVTTALWAVDLNPDAVELAKHNTSEYKVTVLCADATDVEHVLAAEPSLTKHLGYFDAVVTNPPYIPLDAPVTQPEAQHDPDLALYGGSADGTSIPLAIADQALRWLAPGGFFIMEHAHSQAQTIAAALEQQPGWQQVVTLQDLTQTNRFVSATRA